MQPRSMLEEMRADFVARGWDPDDLRAFLMAATHWLTNRGKYTIANTAISSSTDFRCGMINSAIANLSQATVEDLNDVAGLLAVQTELSVAGYARIDLAGVAIAEDDTNNKFTISATAPTTAALTTGQTVTGIFYYIEGANDAARTLISVLYLNAGVPTNGGTMTLPQFVIDGS